MYDRPQNEPIINRCIISSKSSLFFCYNVINIGEGCQLFIQNITWTLPSDMPLSLPSSLSLVLLFLWIGTMIDFLHKSGYNSFDKYGTIICCRQINISATRPSWPADFPFFNFLTLVHISSCVIIQFKTALLYLFTIRFGWTFTTILFIVCSELVFNKLNTLKKCSYHKVL